jgi:hypothetical protein
MKIEEFIDILKNLNITIKDRVTRKGRWGNQSVDFINPKSNNVTEDSFIYARHEIGGVSGGSCWDSSNPQPYTTDEKDPELDNELDLIFKAVCRNISYLAYKEVQSKVSEDYETEREYYGNRTDYKIYFLKIRDLYDTLVELEVLS